MNEPTPKEQTALADRLRQLIDEYGDDALGTRFAPDDIAEWLIDSESGYTIVASDRLTALTKALESIIVRCDEGDPRSDWLPVIAGIARSALSRSEAAEKGARG